jgi:hypothetical protein
MSPVVVITRAQFEAMDSMGALANGSELILLLNAGGIEVEAEPVNPRQLRWELEQVLTIRAEARMHGGDDTTFAPVEILKMFDDALRRLTD